MNEEAHLFKNHIEDTNETIECTAFKFYYAEESGFSEIELLKHFNILSIFKL